MTTFVSADCVFKVEFVEYELSISNSFKLNEDQQTHQMVIAAAGNVVHCGDSERTILTMFSIDQVSISLLVGSKFGSYSRIHLGEADLLEGYISISIFDGPIAVVTYDKKTCIHSLLDEETFSRPIVLQHHSSNVGSTHCTPYQHTVWDCNTAQYIMYLYLRFHCGDAAATVEWMVFDTHKLYAKLAGHGTGMAGDDICTNTWIGRMAYVADSEKYSHDIGCTATNQLPGLQHCSTQDTIVNIAYATTTGIRTACHGRGAIMSSKRREKAVLVVVLNTAGELCCIENGDTLWMRILPIRSEGNPQYLFDIHMKVTESATRPLLLLQHQSTLLLLDIKNNCVVLKEFCNVGAYSCAPFFHPLESHLLVVPVDQTTMLKLLYVSDGEVCSKSEAYDAGTASAAAVATDIDNCNSNVVALHNYFVYELPRIADTRTSQVKSTVAPPSCRSMDPYGLWREDAMMCVDAEAYNSVTWQRIPVHPDTPPEETARGDPQKCIVGKKRRHAAIVELNGAQQGSAIVAASSTPVATIIECNDRTALLTSLGAHLVQLQHELHTYDVTQRYKQAAADYLRSVLINKAASGQPEGHYEHVIPNTSVCISTSSECQNNPYLQRLRAVEDSYMKPITGDHPAASAAAQMAVDVCGTEGGSSQSHMVEDRGPSKCSLLVHSLTCTPLPIKHGVEVTAVVSNNESVSALQSIHLSAYVSAEHSMSRSQLPVNISCESAKVDSLKAQETCCIRALVTLPASVFTAMQAAQLTLHVSVHWRKVSTVASKYGGTVDRSTVLHAGVVRVHIADMYTTERRDSAAPEHSAGFASRPGLPALLLSPTSVTIPVHSYLPRMHITLSSPLMVQLQAIQAQNPYTVTPRQVADQLRAFLRTVHASTFSVDSVGEQVRAHLSAQRWSQWGHSRSILAVDSGSEGTIQSSTQCSSNVVLRYADAIVNPPGDGMRCAELFELADRTVQMSAILCATCGAVDRCASLGNSLLYLRNLLSSEVSIAVQAGGDGQEASALRQAALRLLDELKLEAVKDEAGMMQARVATDVCIAHLYKLLLFAQ